MSENRKSKSPDLRNLGNMEIINQRFEIQQLGLKALDQHLVAIIVVKILW